jgi:hypothetical protein
VFGEHAVALTFSLAFSLAFTLSLVLARFSLAL